MLPQHSHSDNFKPDRLQLAEAANAKLGRAIAKAQSSLAAECKTILDSTIGGCSEPSTLKDSEYIIIYAPKYL